MRKLSREENEPIFYADSMKYEVGEFWKSRITDDIFVITYRDSDKIETPDGLQFRYQKREATSEEIAEIEKAEKEWNSLTSEQRTAEMTNALRERFPGLDW